MYIAPNSNIRLLRNVPLEPDYINTLYFASINAQTTYFQGKTKYTLTAQTYQRVRKGVCRINYKVEDLYDCNYMMFQNASFGTKWFYCFITKVEYVNNVTADVYYTIDVMQTWLTDISLRMCFVEREHSSTDEIGDNIIAEPLALGEMVFNDYDKLTDILDDMAIMILTVDVDNLGKPSGNLIDGIYSGATATAFSTTFDGIRYVNEFLSGYKEKPDAIVAMYMLPLKCLGDYTPAGLDANGSRGLVTPFSAVAEDFEIDGHALTDNVTIDGHIVRNKKLFTYPFNYFHVDNANGRSLALRYEFFNDGDGEKNLTPQFKMYGNITQPITIVLRPRNYKGLEDDDYTRTESIDITSYPMCSWNMDYFTSWLAQNMIPEVLSAFSGILGSVSNAGGAMASLGATGGGAKPQMLGTVNVEEAEKSDRQLATGFAGEFQVVADLVSKTYTASIHTDILRGSLNNANINISSGDQKFFAGRVSVNRQQAEIIDDYFDRYGYATNRLKVPNIHNRRSWNYIKTVGSNVDGNIPGDDKVLIDAIFDKGITFWHNHNNVDNYSLNNDPVSP